MGEQGYAIVSSEQLEQQVIEIDETQLDNLDALFGIEDNDKTDDSIDGESDNELNAELDDGVANDHPSTVKQSKKPSKKGTNTPHDRAAPSSCANNETEHINARSSRTKDQQDVKPNDKPYGDETNDEQTDSDEQANGNYENDDSLHEDTIVMRFQYIKARRKYAPKTSSARFSAHNVIANVTPAGVTFLFTDFRLKAKKSDAKEFELCATKVADAVNKTCKRLTPKVP